MSSSADKIDALTDQLAALLHANPAPEPNVHVLGTIRAFVGEFEAVDGYAGEKAYAIAAKAATYYSDHGALDYRGGPKALFVEMAVDLIGRLRTRARAMRSMGAA